MTPTEHTPLAPTQVLHRAILASFSAGQYRWPLCDGASTMQVTKSLKGLVPSAVTVTGMACGFFAILVSRRGAIGTALALVLAAILCDILDGKLARLLKASSRFGAGLDSFADAISFGVAPGLLLFESSLHRLRGRGGGAP